MVDVPQRYRERLTQLHAELQAVDVRDRSLSSARGVTFLITLGAGLFGLFQPAAVVWMGAAAVGAVFIGLVIAHAMVSTKQFDLQRSTKLLERGLARMDGSYRSGPKEGHVRGDAFVDPKHSYGIDLDVFGSGSVFEQLNSTQTAAGAARLAGWLAESATADAIAERQKAAQELAEQQDLREELALIGMRADTLHHDVRGLLTWAARKEPWDGRTLAVVVAAGLVFAQLGAAVAAFALGINVAVKVWLALVAVQFVALGAMRQPLDRVLVDVISKQSPLGHFHELLVVVEEATVEDAYLRAQQKRIEGSAVSMTKLDGLVGMASVRHNGIVHLLANLFLMWDVWCAWRLDMWRDEFGGRVGGWLDALGEVEALAALGTFAAEHPDYAWPVIDEGDTRLLAKGLGHPLLPPQQRVLNDVALGDPTRALMITGSNMSGKSTMLRSMGVATVLAHAGAPVCAQELTMSRVRLRTSVRVDDSLEHGASRFYAEVRALKEVIDSLEEEGPPVLFLLDEVLHGTNSRERVIGAKAVVEHLVKRGAIGAVTSHDLGLVKLEDATGGKIRNVHFEDHLENGEMAFDYKMKQGPVSTSNALRLMRQVGITVVPVD